ncbi:MAG: DUF3108 domain-containing protein [Bacteroidales bacterium]|jgi:hypothetical protein|nr:DUF3108 domain-containing protein [Bacteroidales bacterium]MDD3160545.1 DUF3108 domain-containing protein [Bacteroidales bacterium]
MKNLTCLNLNQWAKAIIKPLFLLILFVALGESLSAQTVLKANLLKGENLQYDLYYKNGIMIRGGKITLNSHLVNYEGKQAFECKMIAATNSFVDNFYRVRDTLISYLDTDNLQTLRFWKSANEGKKYSSIEGGTFTYRNGEIDVYAYKKRPGKELEEVNLTVKGECTDMVSVAYLIRGLDMNIVTKNKDIPLMLFSGKKKYDMKLRYKGTERIKANNDKKYNCFKFALYVYNKEAFKDEESMVFWITDDTNRIPIQLDTKVKVGTLRGIYKGNR